MSQDRKPGFIPTILLFAGVLLITVSLLMLIGRTQSDAGVTIRQGNGFSGQIMVAFITGLTTGGLSCLAVQGGLLASSLSQQIERDYLEHSRHRKPQKKHLAPPRTNAALPILLFLIAKLVAYTLLGVLLGWAGEFLTLSPLSRALLMIFIGVFMVGNALRMFNVHPIFRYFSIEPPKFITRYIRRTAKGTDTFTPLFLGALTVFIPCGVTQAMMAAALATGSPVSGAALMFAFTLGTSPVFFIIAYLTTELGARLEKTFMRFVAVVVLILGFVTLDGGLNLMGSPFSIQNLSRSLFQSNTLSAVAVDSSQASNINGELVLYVQDRGYFPTTLKASAGKELKLNLITNNTYSCARDFVIPALQFYQFLPDTGTVQVAIPPQAKGTRMFFTCSMGMYTGMIIFE